MIVRKAYRYKLEPTGVQTLAFFRIAGCCRFIFNWALNERKKAYAEGKSLNYRDQQNALPALKKEFPWLKEVPSHTLQAALKDLDSAYKRFFKGLGGYPQFRRRGRDDRFRFPDPSQFALNQKKSSITAPKFGMLRKDAGAIKVNVHRPLKGRTKTMSIVREGGAWHASFSVELSAQAPAVNQGAPVGIDRGVEVPFAMSDGTLESFEAATPRTLLRQRRLQQSIARKKEKGPKDPKKRSKNYNKAVKRLSRHAAKIARRRKDALHKISDRLTKNHGLIVIEALKVQHMTKSAAGTLAEPGKNVAQKSGLNRAILNVGWGEFRRQILYKAAWRGGRVVEVDPRSTSRTCSTCQTVDADSRVTRGSFVCRACGHEEHADINAAKNILARGLAAGAGNPKTGEGLSLAACRDLCASMSMKQEAKGESPGELAAALARRAKCTQRSLGF
jgi:putative transposase